MKRDTPTVRQQPPVPALPVNTVHHHNHHEHHEHQAERRGRFGLRRGPGVVGVDQDDEHCHR